MSGVSQLPASNEKQLRNASAASFCAAISENLGRSSIELQGYPEVAVRIQHALADENTSAQQLVKLVGSEPVLASRVLCIANSAALNSRRDPVTELRSAITRIGMEQLRSAVSSYAMAQLRGTKELQVVAEPLRDLWQTSAVMAAMCSAIARHTGTVNPDAALLAGLLHGVGKLYILTKASRHPEVLATPGLLTELIYDWHATIARVLLEQWQVPSAIVEAVGEYEYYDRRAEQVPIRLGGVLYLGALLTDQVQDPDWLDTLVSTSPAVARFGFSEDQLRELVGESERDIAELLDSLGM